MNSHLIPPSSAPPNAPPTALLSTGQALEAGVVAAGTVHAATFPLDRDTLYSEFAPLVRRLIRQYGDNAELRQDLAGEIYYRFCLLLDAYDPTSGVPLRPYLVRQLSASIYTYARHQWRRAKRETSLSPSGLLENGSLCEPAHPHDPTKQWDHNLATEQVLRELPEA